MDFKITRELLGSFGQGGWRPALIGWGIGSAIVALAWAFVYRFAMGTTTLQDIAALAPVAAILAQYIHARGRPIPRAPTGGLINNEALAWTPTRWCRASAFSGRAGKRNRRATPRSAASGIG